MQKGAETFRHVGTVQRESVSGAFEGTFSFRKVEQLQQPEALQEVVGDWLCLSLRRREWTSLIMGGDRTVSVSTHPCSFALFSHEGNY